MTLFLVRHSKNPNLSASIKSPFHKDFYTVEDAVRYMKNNRSCYILRIKSSRREKQIFCNKLISALSLH